MSDGASNGQACNELTQSFLAKTSCGNSSRPKLKWPDARGRDYETAAGLLSGSRGKEKLILPARKDGAWVNPPYGTFNSVKKEQDFERAVARKRHLR